MLLKLEERYVKKYSKHSKILGQLVWLNACLIGLSVASGISSVATLSTFIGLPVSIPLGAISQAGVSVSGVATALTSKYQKKLTKITKLVDIVTSAISVFEMSLPKALNNGEIDEREFAILQELHLKAVNELSNADCKKTEISCKKFYWKREPDIRKTFRTRDASRFAHYSCLLSSVLPKWISSKISTINLIIFGKARKSSENCENLVRKTISHQTMAVSTSYLASAFTSSRAC